MKVYLARHGQTNYNELGLCNADPSIDVHLTETGTQQANNLAERLKDADFQQIFISELRRTKQTADIINEFHSAPITVDARLNDNRTGFEGKPADEYRVALHNSEDSWTVRFNGGESLQDVKERVESFIKDLKTQPYQTVLIVTSEIIVQVFHGLVTGLPIEEMWNLQVDKGSCIEVEL